MIVVSLTDQSQEVGAADGVPEVALNWVVPDAEFEETDDPVDEVPFTAEELKQLALTAGLRVLEG